MKSFALSSLLFFALTAQAFADAQFQKANIVGRWQTQDSLMVTAGVDTLEAFLDKDDRLVVTVCNTVDLLVSNKCLPRFRPDPTVAPVDYGHYSDELGQFVVEYSAVPGASYRLFIKADDSNTLICPPGDKGPDIAYRRL